MGERELAKEVGKGGGGLGGGAIIISHNPVFVAGARFLSEVAPILFYKLVLMILWQLFTPS